MSTRPSAGRSRHLLSALGLSIGLFALAGCHDRDTPAAPPQRQYHFEDASDWAKLTPRQALIRDVTDMLIYLQDTDSAAGANPAEFNSGHGSFGSVNGHRRVMIFPRAAQRAEIYRLRDSLLATGSADFSDTLRVSSGPIGSSHPGPPPLFTKPRSN